MKQSTSFAQVANKLLTVLQGYSKTIRLLLVMFLTLAVSAEALGAEETITLSDFGWGNATVQSSITATSATISLAKNSAGNAPTYYTKDGLRIYGVKSATTGGTISFTPKTGITISKIVFTHTSENSGVLAIKTGPGSYSSKTWSGTLTEGNSVSLVSTNNTNNNPQVRITKIVITYETAAAATYKVTYNANGATSGTAPTDATSYTSGTTVTVKSNSGNLAKTGYTFGGWNTKSDGTGTNYTAGSGTFTITANTTLYAKWNTATKYTVKFYKTSTTFESVTETSVGAGVAPPIMEQECGDWTFQGWSESQSNSENNTTELELVTLTDGKYYPTEDVNLYPVYTKSEGGGGTVSWNKITTAPADWSGEYLIVNSNYAMTSDFYSSGEFKGASVTVSNNQVTSSPSDKMIWIVEKNGSNAQYSFKNKSTGTYANITGTNSTNAALSSSVIWFTISSSSTSGVWKINSVTYSARCFSYYSTNNSFRTYANSSNTTGSLYKKEGSGSTTYYYSYPQCTAEPTPSLNADPTSLAFGNVATDSNKEMTFTLTGSNLTANAELALSGTNESMFSVNPTSVTQSDGTINQTDITVTYTPTATGSHNATLTISSTGAESKTVALSGTGTAPAAKYTVTFNAGSGTCDDESLTETSGGAGVTLPTANPPAACATDGWEFAGWWTAEVGATTTSPGELLTAGSNYKPTNNCTLYAVYSYTEAGGGGSGFYLSVTKDATTYYIGEKSSSGSFLSAVTDINSAATFNIENNQYLYYGNKTYVSSTSDNTSLTIATTTPTVTWAITDEGETITFKSNGTGGRYLAFNYNSGSPRFSSYGSTYTYELTKHTTSTTTYNSNPTCLVPVWNGADIDKTAFTVNCGGRSPMTGDNGAAKITFPKEKIYDFTKDIKIEATTGFLVSTNQTEDANYKSSVYLSPRAGNPNANTFHEKPIYVRAEAPAMSEEDLSGTITIKNDKGETLQTFSVTADVTCTQYTLTLVDRGVSTEQPTKYYAGETIDEAPADPEGVCTEPIHYVFDGWAAATVDEGSTTYTKVTFPYTVTGNTTFYAVYRYVEEGSGDSGDYVKLTEDLDDYSGDYLIVYETGNVAFDGGRNNVDDELDATSNTIEVTINDNTIASNATTDAAKFTIAKVDGGYSIQSASGYYIGRSATSNGLSTNETYSANYDLNTITDCKTIKGKGGNILKYNKASDQKRFRYYQSDQEDIALYRKAASYLYTTSPVCGPHLVITEGKEIYVTGGNAQAARDLVMAQQKVSYKATRLKTIDGSPEGTAPDVKVAINGITKGGVVTTEVKVTFENTVKEQQADDTYTITGDIVVTYEADANNMQEDIQVQLAVDYSANADARDNFTVHARSLPEKFVIVAKQGDKWYALNGDMNGNDAEPANGQVTLNDLNNPTEATYAPCNAIYTFEAMPQGAEDRISVRFIGQDNKYLWAASGTNTGIQNNSTNPAADALAYNWKLYTQDNITYQFGNANSNRQLTLNGEKFGMYASGVQDIRILPYVEKCVYNYAPSNLKVTVLKGTYVTLTWDAVAGATKYQYSTDATNWNDAGTEPTATITGLTGDNEYTYYIRAYHEDAGVSKECIDYAEITFTTANCDDVPTDITYSADLNSITVSWTAAAPTATITYNTKEDGTGGGGTINNATSPCRISGGLNPNTTYYIQILANGTCASPIIPVKTEDVEVDIVEWDPQGIIVDINTDETIGVTLENEVSYGSGSGSLAEDLFFSKYFEGSGSLKMIAIYNGTGKDVDLSEYRIDRGSNGDATNISKTYDLSQLGIIKQGQEIIFYSWPLTSEYSYSCSQSFLDSKVQESGLDANPRWILCDAKTHNGIEFEAMDFSGNDPLLLYKSSELIDVFGVSTEQESPASTQICSGRSDQAWSADGVTNMDYGKTTEDFPNGEIPHGVNVDDETITAYTARVIMFRKNTVVSGKNAVTKNTTTFATFAEEWEARQVCMSGDDGDLTCAAYQELGTFDYSDYYTKYESMGEGTTFEENDRNADGTVTIPITDLYKHACSNIRVKLTNSSSEVLSDREYKVPIMITTDQETAYTDENKNQNAFYALQENLATVEVDGEGNPTGNKTNLTLEQVREICKTCDVVIRDNATLTKRADDAANDHPQVHDVIVYEGASIVIPDGTNHNYTINSLSLRRKGDVVASAQVQGTGKFVLPADAPVTLSMHIDANNWHWFTLPYDCDIADVTWSDGTPAKYNTDWFLMYYDGESRAASTNPYDNHWKVYGGTTIEAGKGYIIGITGDLAHPDYTFELRFPMAQGVLTAEQTNKTVALNAWGVKSDNTPNNKGWNLVGNPYLNYYKTADEYSFAGLPLIEYTGIDPVTGDRLYDDNGNIPFLVTPIDGGWSEYQQELASEVNMMPFTAYFVQVGDPDTHENGQALDASFEASNRGKKSILRRAPSEVDDLEEPAIVAVSLTNAKGESDKTTLLIADRFTSEYEMNADFFKWFGDYYTYYTKPVLYTVGADQGKRAFNALNEELATQPISLGMYAAQAGNYTFSLDLRSDLSKVQEVWLHDATQDTHINLLQESYTFHTAKTESAGRFFLSVKMAPKVSTEMDNVTDGTVWATTQDHTIVVNGLLSDAQLWIYDATGKLLHTDHTLYYQHSYSVPQSGTYFVRVQNTMQTQTIKVVVE